MNTNATSTITPHIKRAGEIALYLHVPFCHARCSYCDFYSTTSSGALSDYIDAMKRALEELATTGVRLCTVYFGGGTPSLLGVRLTELLSEIYATFDVLSGAECTVEVNPESLDTASLNAWMENGVNRVSMGVQALADEPLALMGRLHNATEARAKLKLLQRSGVNFSADLIAGIPGVTQAAMRAWIHEVVASGAHHLSIYPLSVSPESALGRDASFTPLDEDRSADALLDAWRAAQEEGLCHYEISNFAFPGAPSQHNSSYWQAIPYVGLGPSAASMVPTKDGGRLRFVLHDTLSAFISASRFFDIDFESDSCELLTREEAKREDIMLGMRMATGVKQEAAHAAGLSAVFESLIADGLARSSADGLSFLPTERGWMLGNEMFERIWLPE